MLTSKDGGKTWMTLSWSSPLVPGDIVSFEARYVVNPNPQWERFFALLNMPGAE